MNNMDVAPQEASTKPTTWPESLAGLASATPTC